MICRFQIYLWGWRTLLEFPSRNKFPSSYYLDTYKYQRPCWWFPNRRWYWSRK